MYFWMCDGPMAYEYYPLETQREYRRVRLSNPELGSTPVIEWETDDGVHRYEPTAGRLAPDTVVYRYAPLDKE